MFQSPRRYGNHLSTVLDDRRISSIGFRISDPGDGSIPHARGFLWTLTAIVGVFANGTRSPPLPGTVNATVEGRGGGGKVFWPNVAFKPPVDLSSFEVMEIDCAFNDTAGMTTDNLVVFNDDASGTNRAPTITRTSAATLSQDEGWANLTAVFDEQDTRGRAFSHSRTVALRKDPDLTATCKDACRLTSPLLCVFDTFAFAEAGEYAVGPAWHVHQCSAPRRRC